MNITNNDDSIITNCAFISNYARSQGGAIYVNSADITLVNCIFWGNYANEGSQIYIVNSTSSVTYSCVQGGYTGTGNISADPLLANMYDFADVTTSSGTTTTIKVADASLYAVDDEIEYNNDDVARKVTAVNTTTDIVTFAGDALSASSEVYIIIHNWGSGATDLDVDVHLISSSSPCKDAGDPNGTYTGQKDMDGEDRVNGTYVDIGADEYYSN